MKSDAGRIVESLLDDEASDPKDFVNDNLHPMDIVTMALNEIVSLPYRGEQDLEALYAKIKAIINDMVEKLEKMTGRKALDGLREMLVAGSPKPFNYEPGYQIKPARAREVVGIFRNCSKPVKPENDAVAADPHKAPDKWAYRLQRLRHRRGEM